MRQIEQRAGDFVNAPFVIDLSQPPLCPAFSQSLLKCRRVFRGFAHGLTMTPFISLRMSRPGTVHSFLQIALITAHWPIPAADATRGSGGIPARVDRVLPRCNSPDRPFDCAAP